MSNKAMEDSRNFSIYSSDMKMADLVANDPILLSILERLGVKLGFGDASVREVCKRYGLSSSLFLIICNIYSFRNYKPEVSALTANDIKKIMDYLKASHRYYTTVCFPALHDDIHRMAKTCDDINSNIINLFYDNYDVEASRHFAYEEEVVFPYVESLIGKRVSSDTAFSIATFEGNHSNIEEKLSDLKNILIKYLPESCDSEARRDVLLDIFRIESDLSKHTLIEDKLLIPIVAKLERND